MACCRQGQLVEVVGGAVAAVVAEAVAGVVAVVAAMEAVAAATAAAEGVMEAATAALGRFNLIITDDCVVMEKKLENCQDRIRNHL